MTKSIIRFLALCALLSAPVPALADIVKAHPVIWHVKAKSGGGQVTLFGSLHILPANIDWLTPDILHDVQRADVFVFEVPTDPASQAALNGLIAAHGSLPDGQSLRTLLPAESQSDYDAAIATAHLSTSITDREQPWLVSLQLSLAETMNRNYFPDAGVDYVMMSWATGHSRSVRYLETIDQQFALLAPGDDTMQLAELESGLKGLSQAPDEIAPLITAWGDGDVARINALMDTNFANRPEQKKKLLTDRNKRWAGQVEEMLMEGHNIFVTVGAAHLGGPDGVPALLRQAGYEVDGP